MESLNMRLKADVSIMALFLAVLFLNLFAVDAAFAAAATPAPADDEEWADEAVKPGEAKPDKFSPERRFTQKQEFFMAIEKRKAKTKDELPPFKMVLVKGGCFEMGDFSGEGDDDERPVHEVCVSSFYISETEVTHELFEKVTGYKTGDPKMPITKLNQKYIKEFLKRLNELTKGGYRLPSEAEWEYAAREGGKKIRWAGTDDEGSLGDYAWFDFNSEFNLQHVRQKKPNALGLYDMSGNAAELCDDYFDFEYYKRSPKRDPLNDRHSAWRVVRGGSSVYDSNRLRTAFRYAYDPKLTFGVVGFRLAQ